MATVTGRRAFSVSVFCRNGGAVLLVLHRRLGVWVPVGGEVEPGETPLEAAVRELREETGLAGEFPPTSPIAGAPRGLIGYEEHPAGSKGLHMNFVFLADVPSRALAGCDEFEEVRWVTSGAEVPSPENVRQLVEVALAAPRG